jgi:hypothetical protein
MHSSFADSRENSSQQWPDARQHDCNDSNHLDHYKTAIELDPDLAVATTRTPGQPFSPWLVPGVGISI